MGKAIIEALERLKNATHFSIDALKEEHKEYSDKLNRVQNSVNKTRKQLDEKVEALTDIERIIEENK